MICHKSSLLTSLGLKTLYEMWTNPAPQAAQLLIHSEWFNLPQASEPDSR